jgi:hypothetical protein
LDKDLGKFDGMLLKRMPVVGLDDVQEGILLLPPLHTHVCEEVCVDLK